MSRETLSDLSVFIRDLPNRNKVLIETHPIWNDEHPIYLTVFEQVRRQYPKNEIVRMNPFRTVRCPSDYV